MRATRIQKVIWRGFCGALSPLTHQSKILAVLTCDVLSVFVLVTLWQTGVFEDHVPKTALTRACKRPQRGSRHAQSACGNGPPGAEHMAWQEAGAASSKKFPQYY